MTSLGSYETRKSGSADNECAQFVLAQIESVRQMHMFFTRRFENLVSFYLATLGVVLSAVIVIVTSSQPLTAHRVPLALLGIGVWGFSIVIYTRLGMTRAMMVCKAAEMTRFEEYFCERYPSLRRYFWRQSDGSTTANVWALWQGQAFPWQTVALFRVLAGFIGALASATSVPVISLVLEDLGRSARQRSDMRLLWYSIGVVGAFCGTLLLTSCILRWQRKQAEKYARQVLADIFALRVESDRREGEAASTLRGA